MRAKAYFDAVVSKAAKVILGGSLKNLRAAVLSLVAQGWSNAEIAEALSISSRSVAAHKAHKTISEKSKKEDALPDFAWHALRSAKGRAADRGVACLSEVEYDAKWRAQGGVCALSGVAFCDAQVRADAKVLSRPLRPSLDRIDTHGDYSAQNVRIVTQIVNFAAGEWPLKTFHEMCT